MAHDIDSDFSAFGNPLIESQLITVGISPKDPNLWLSLMGRSLAFLIEGRFEEADEAGKRAIAVPNAPIIVRVIHAAALGNLGRLDEARASIDTMQNLDPGFY